jgi:hypothetical protein
MIRARVFVAAGVPVIRSSGLILCPLHVYFPGISAPAEKAGLVTAIPELDPLAELKMLSASSETVMPNPRQFMTN